ncbi:hypothetical protein IAI09_06585 [Lysinibacillus fusiformis]|nr:hypothetical protein [Lysinibacillus fusiformis]
MLKKVQMNKDRSKNAHLGERFFVEVARCGGDWWKGSWKVTDRAKKAPDSSLETNFD